MWAFLMVAGLFPPQKWHGIELNTLSFSNIGPRLTFEEDGSVRFADDFSYWLFVFRMFVLKAPGTFLYIYGSPFIAMLLVWHFSMLSVMSCVIFWAIVFGNLSMSFVQLTALYYYGKRKSEKRRVQRAAQHAEEKQAV